MPHDNECTRCRWDYPEDVPLSPVIGSTHRGDVCGICALEMTNVIHGIKRTRFTGEMAEEFRLLAIKARQNRIANPPKKEEY